ncbi:MAG: DUF1592 domain-containing protein [Polyangia bacterium]
MTVTMPATTTATMTAIGCGAAAGAVTAPRRANDRVMPSPGVGLRLAKAGGALACAAVCLATLASCGRGAAKPVSNGPDAGAAGSGGAADTGGGGSGGGVGPDGPGGAGTGGLAPVAGVEGSFIAPPALDRPPSPEDAGPLALRRLTVREYSNTVSDLLGIPVSGNLPFPVDQPNSTGFLAPTDVTLLDAERLVGVAERLATAAMAAGTIPVPCGAAPAPAPGAAATACATEFIATFGRRAFRRPLSALEASELLDVFSVTTAYGLDFRTSLVHVISALLQSGSFLYHWELADAAPARDGSLVVLGPHQVASRLSYLLWATMPDEALLAAADTNNLATPEELLAQAKRMFTDVARMKNGLASFHDQWLRVTGLDDLWKDPAKYPTFTPGLAAAFAEESHAYVSSVLSGGGDGTLKTLLTAPYSYANEPLAALYGVVGGGEAFPRVQLNATQRAGILTQPAFLASGATPTDTNPIKRGSVVWRRLLCGVPASTLHPDDDIPGPVIPGASNRARYGRLSQPTCAGCHSSFDPLGFAFEHYDAIGAYQTSDNGATVDASGEVMTPGGVKLAFRDAVDLATGLADSDEVKWCLTRHWFRYLMGRMDTAADLGSMERAYRAGAAVPGFSVPDLLTTAAQTKVFRYRALSPGEI